MGNSQVRALLDMSLALRECSADLIGDEKKRRNFHSSDQLDQLISECAGTQVNA
jgi:hypothetical protein